MLIITNLFYLFDNFVYFKYNLNETEKDETWVANYQYKYVSLLNSHIIDRRWNDRIFGITEDQCKDISFWKKRKYFCERSKKYGTLLSAENDQYKCNNEDYLGRLI